MKTQKVLKQERDSFKKELKIYCRLNMISQRSIASAIEVTEQEYYNFLNGFQSSIKNKIHSFDHFKELIFSHLRVKDL